MMNGMWGLLGPETVSSARRVRGLGVGSCVRNFNDLAVPGIGGIWFGKQLLLSTLGIVVAETARASGAKVHNIEVTNAIEAAACLMALTGSQWERDPRLLGATKLMGKALGKNAPPFKIVRQRNFYVTQPMRMASVQALPALGLVSASGQRFNAFEVTDAGRQFVEAACSKVTKNLVRWVIGSEELSLNIPQLKEISPLTPLPESASSLLVQRLLNGAAGEAKEDRDRRANAWHWAAANAAHHSHTWASRPDVISEHHWNDLQAGALFFAVRDAAIALLDALEAKLRNQTGNMSLSLPNWSRDHSGALAEQLATLRTAATAYRAFPRTANDDEANRFCDECKHPEDDKLLRALVKRDSRVLVLRGEEITPGPAFRAGAATTSQGGSSDTAESEQESSASPDEFALPDGISYRMRNMWYLQRNLTNASQKDVSV